MNAIRVILDDRASGVATASRPVRLAVIISVFRMMHFSCSITVRDLSDTRMKVEQIRPQLPKSCYRFANWLFVIFSGWAYKKYAVFRFVPETRGDPTTLCPGSITPRIKIKSKSQRPDGRRNAVWLPSLTGLEGSISHGNRRAATAGRMLSSRRGLDRLYRRRFYLMPQNL